MSFWLRITLVLVFIWALVGGAVYWARASKPTADSVAAYIRSSDLSTKSGGERAKIIGRVEDSLNRITFEDRQRLNRDRVLRAFFETMTPEEQMAYLDATLPTGFKQMMESFNKMEPAKRKEFVDRAVSEMKKHEGEDQSGDGPNGNPVDPALRQKMIDQGMRAFYSDASAETKLDMAPLIEQMQKNVQSGGDERRVHAD